MLECFVIHSQRASSRIFCLFSEGIADFLFAEVPLEQALDLRADGRGKSTARRAYLLNRRNAALCAAWALCDGDSPWQQSIALASAVKRFQSILWPRWRSLDHPPCKAADINRHLFTAHRCGAMPTSPLQLHRIAVLMNPDAG